jgi:MFS family permease
MSDAPLPPLNSENAPPLTGVQWLICAIAVIGFAFDTYELLMLPLVLRPALMELGGLRPGTPEFAHWFSLLFYVPAVAGGVFGLLGGYLTDRLGRRRVLTWSILLYGFSAFFAGYSTSLVMLLVLRTTTFIGVCVEFVAAVAWLAELFPNPRQRERVLGYTQAFSSIGGFMVAFANGFAIDWVKSGALPHLTIPAFLHPAATHGVDAAWRYTLMSGLIPAIPLIIVRPFLPESPLWRAKKAAGTLRRPRIGELFAPALRRTTIVTTIMFACSLGAAFGAIQQMPQIVPALPEIPKLVDAELAKPKPATTAAGVTTGVTTAPAIAALPGTAPTTRPVMVTAAPPTAAAAAAGKPGPAGKPDPKQIARATVVQATASGVTKLQEAGGLVGRFLLAFLALRIVSRRALIRVFQVPGLIVMPLVFGWAATHGLTELKTGMFFAGLLTVGQLSFWGNYLPRVFPVHLRGTGESFAANVGGRMIGTVFAVVTASIAAAVTPHNPDPVTAARYWAYTAAGVGTFVYLVGFVSSFFLPEPGHGDLDEGAGAAGATAAATGAANRL